MEKNKKRRNNKLRGSNFLVKSSLHKRELFFTIMFTKIVNKICSGPHPVFLRPLRTKVFSIEFAKIFSFL